jgi:hypothetical protein
MRKESRMSNIWIILISTFAIALTLVTAYLVLAILLIGKMRAVRLWLTRKMLGWRAQTYISEEETVAWLAMQKSFRRGFWKQKEPAHE